MIRKIVVIFPFSLYHGALMIKAIATPVQAKMQMMTTIPVTMMAVITSLLTLGFSSISVTGTSCYDFNIQYITPVNKQILRLLSQ